MALDSCFYISGEVSVERHGGTVRFSERDGFGKQPARLRP